jgi:hypothetical protein
MIEAYINLIALTLIVAASLSRMKSLSQGVDCQSVGLATVFAYALGSTVYQAAELATLHGAAWPAHATPLFQSMRLDTGLNVGLALFAFAMRRAWTLTPVRITDPLHVAKCQAVAEAVAAARSNEELHEARLIARQIFAESTTGELLREAAGRARLERLDARARLGAWADRNPREG